jgi:hypothetical protein
MSDEKKRTPWRAPTRRSFVAMLGAAAAALVVKDRAPEPIDLRKTPTGKTRWIGHV